VILEAAAHSGGRQVKFSGNVVDSYLFFPAHKIQSVAI
jgi:hypothetical protein